MVESVQQGPVLVGTLFICPMMSVHSMKLRSLGTLHLPPIDTLSYFPSRLPIRGAAREAYWGM